MHADIGCGYLIVKSTGLPHIPQTDWVAYIRALFFSKAVRCSPYLSGLFSGVIFDLDISQSSHANSITMGISYFFPVFDISTPSLSPISTAIAARISFILAYAIDFENPTLIPAPVTVHFFSQ